MPRTKVSKEWQEVLDRGCEWCGTKLSGLHKPNSEGYVTYGLHEAHIFAEKYAPIDSWNTFLLCPNCHTIFDHIVKPRLQQAIEAAVYGFENPSGSGRKFIVGSTHEEVLERLITKDKAKRPRSLPPKPAGLSEWHKHKET